MTDIVSDYLARPARALCRTCLAKPVHSALMSQCMSCVVAEEERREQAREDASEYAEEMRYEARRDDY